MVISLSWLRDFVNVNASAQEIADKLSVSGLEVEHLGVWETVKGGLKGFVTGEVLECAKHPNADKLSITKVDIGTGEPQPIVCGAPNVAAGQKVIVATPGTEVTVPGKGTFTIGEAKIRGEISRGMICAEDEIGIGNSHDGILVLPPDTPVGLPASEYFRVTSEEIIEIGLTANRGDAASHLGVARDVAALFGVKTENYKPAARPLATGKWNIEIEDPAICSCYVALDVEDTTIVESPSKIKNRLLSIGIDPKNVVVDATNYTLHALGQPIHAFDADKISGSRIQVRKAAKGERFVTLDKAERECLGGELVIADESGVIAFAGVMGGLDTAVTENTRNIIIESAHFNPGLVRKTARMHGLSTDASFRFERGTDPLICDNAAMYTADLITSVTGGKSESRLLKIAEEYKTRTTTINTSKLSEFAGAEIPESRVTTILSDLGFKVEAKEGVIYAEIPSWRNDIESEVDLYEEVMRIYGYDQIPMSGKMMASLPDFTGVKKHRRQQAVSRFLNAHGFFEIMNNSLTSARFYTEEEEKHLVQLTNPLSSDMEYMRGSLLPGMLQAAAYNRNRKVQDIRFFEFGRMYKQFGETITETDCLGVLLSGNSRDESWLNDGRKMDDYYARQMIETALRTAGLPKAEYHVSEVSADLKKKADLEGEFWYAEVDWSAANVASKDRIKVKLPSKFQLMRRDLSLVTDRSMSFRELEKTIEKCNIEILKSTTVFDVYEGKPLDEGKKAIAIAFYLGNDQETLTDETADKAMNMLIEAFEKTGVTIRR